MMNISPDMAPQETLDALAVLADYRGATADALDPQTWRAAVQDSIPTVWIVLADDQESGYGDMDNRVDIVGTYASLAVAVADIYRKIIIGERIYNPTFTQRVIATTLTPLPLPTICEAGSLLGTRPTQDGCDYDGDDAEYRDNGPF
jgi:hypothetical protein